MSSFAERFREEGLQQGEALVLMREQGYGRKSESLSPLRRLSISAKCRSPV